MKDHSLPLHTSSAWLIQDYWCCIRVLEDKPIWMMVGLWSLMDLVFVMSQAASEIVPTVLSWQAWSPHGTACMRTTSLPQASMLQPLWIWRSLLEPQEDFAVVWKKHCWSELATNLWQLLRWSLVSFISACLNHTARVLSAQWQTLKLSPGPFLHEKNE